ncbi:MAG TPA: hypothetical protein PKD54_00295 [Pirellulaceae bacterium]|nr:hypothetical protein [Pirellulaceae bacterium]
MSKINWDELISAYLDGELLESERVQVEELLANDENARQTLESFAAQRKMFQQFPRVMFSAEARQRVLAEVTQYAARRQRPQSAQASAGISDGATHRLHSRNRWAHINWRPATLFAVSLASLLMVGFIWLRNRDGIRDPLAHGPHTTLEDRSEHEGGVRPPTLHSRSESNEMGRAGDFANRDGDMNEANMEMDDGQPRSLAGTDAPGFLGRGIDAGPGSGSESEGGGEMSGRGSDVATIAQGGLGGVGGLGVGNQGLLAGDRLAVDSGQRLDAAMHDPHAKLGGVDSLAWNEVAQAEQASPESETVSVDQMCIVVVPDDPEQVARLIKMLLNNGLSGDGVSLDGLSSGQVEVVLVHASPAVMAKKISRIAEVTEVVFIDTLKPIENVAEMAHGVVPTIRRDAHRILLAQVFNNVTQGQNPHGRFRQHAVGGRGESSELGAIEGREGTISDGVVSMGRAQVAGKPDSQPTHPFNIAGEQASDAADELDLNNWLNSLEQQGQSLYFVGPGHRGQTAEIQKRLVFGQIPPAEESLEREDSARRNIEQQADVDELSSVPQENGRYLILFGRDLPLEKYLQRQQPRPDQPATGDR